MTRDNKQQRIRVEPDLAAAHAAADRIADAYAAGAALPRPDVTKYDPWPIGYAAYLKSTLRNLEPVC